jgi:hypothetical protein
LRGNWRSADLAVAEKVLVTDVLQQDFPLAREWIGSLDGSVNADIRVRVSGYLVSVWGTGSDVAPSSIVLVVVLVLDPLPSLVGTV